MEEQNIRFEQNAGGETGIVFEIERFSVNDGPGIRTLVFLKGCPLRCRWCANPESHSFAPQLVYWRSRCIGCKSCIGACPNGALSAGENGIDIDRTLCVTCGSCTRTCNSNALIVMGKRMSVGDVMRVAARDEQFYRQSGGGVTFSGGEALAQPEFLLSLARASKDAGYHVCMETSGYAPWAAIEPLLPYIDVFLYDIKAVDDEVHKACTGVSNVRILDNFERLSRLKDIIVRYPVIPGYNDSPGDIRKMTAFLHRFHEGKRLDILPYHRLGVSKYQRLGREYGLADILPPSTERMRELRDHFISEGFAAEIGG